MRYTGEQIFADDENELSLLQRAALFGDNTKTLHGIRSSELSSGSTFLALRGLANISLQEEGADFHGLTPDQASLILDELLGRSEDTVPVEWAD